MTDTAFAPSPDKRRLFWRLHLLGWAGFATVQFLLGLSYLGFLSDLANRAALFLIGASLSLLLRAIYRRLRLLDMRILPAIGLIFACCVPTGISMALLMNEATKVTGGVFEHPTLMDWFNMAFTWTFILLGWSVLYIGINYRLQAESSRERAIRAEALVQQARLQALRAQLEPHFLFNTLNAIATLVIERDNPAALAMLNNLSRFLRMTLDQAGAAEISVAEELEFAQRYAEIQQTRFGDRLKMDFEVEPAVMRARVPALILQPLVENAVKHGVLSQERPGRVSVSIRADGGRLAICVQDDGPGFGAAPVRHGVGLANTAARLDALYGDAARLSLGAAAGQGSAVVIELPLRSEAA